MVVKILVQRETMPAKIRIERTVADALHIDLLTQPLNEQKSPQ